MDRTITNWNKYPKIQAKQSSFSSESYLHSTLNQSKFAIARGNGRCYGDASLGDHVISTLKFNKILGFDSERGIFYAQSGVLLADILEIIVPKGWFLPVTPGTKFITLGGAISSDVHGKNHHKEGSFSNHVRGLEILCADGEIHHCSKDSNVELFETTCGGNGLTGVILTAQFQLKKIATSYIKETRIKCQDLNEVCDMFDKYNKSTYSVAWIDCLKSGDGFGRSILMLGEHAEPNELTSKQQLKPLIVPSPIRLDMPFNLPSFILNKYSIQGFNYFFYHKNTVKEKTHIVNYNSFFYPLDGIIHWNRMYGKKGFVQYQFVLPAAAGRKGLSQILKIISDRQKGSFLSVLKLFGKQESLMSFPMEGYTLALDFPISKGLFSFLDELDQIVVDFGGRIYLSKDARLDKKFFFAGYPNAKEFIIESKDIILVLNSDHCNQKDYQSLHEKGPHSWCNF